MQMAMDIHGLPEADQHLVYGLLLKRKRPRAQERKVLSIVRSTMALPDKIQAIVGLGRVKVLEPRRVGAGAPPPDARVSGGQASDARRPPEESLPSKKRKAAIVVDARQEITRLLKKCALKRELFFSRAGDRYDALELVIQTRARLLVVNEPFDQDDEYLRYFEICRAIVPGVRLVFLGGPAGIAAAPARFSAATRFLPKPLNMGKLETAVRALVLTAGTHE